MRRKQDRSTSNDRPSSRRGSRSGSGTPRRRRNQRTPTTPTRSRANLDKRFNSGSRTRPIIKPDKYDGKTDLETYLVKFESLASYNGWDQLDRAAHLKASLIDGAASLLWQVQDASYQEVVNKLRCRYGTHEQQEKFRLELRTRKRKPGDKVQELSQDIERLVSLAFPEAGSETCDVLARESFIEALGDPGFAYKIREKGPVTLQEAVMTTMKLEVLRDTRIYSRDSNRPRNVRSTQADNNKEQRQAPQASRNFFSADTAQNGNEKDTLRRRVNQHDKEMKTLRGRVEHLTKKDTSSFTPYGTQATS